MSHRDDCPDEYDARRDGERAHDFGRGYYSNPYRDREEGCDEAASAWSSGYRAASARREEERAEEARAERRAEERLADEESAEDAYYEERAEAEAAERDSEMEAEYYEAELDAERNGDHEEPPAE